MSVDKSIKQKQPDTSHQYVNIKIQPVSSTKSWSDDTITAPPPPPLPTVKKQEKPNTKSWSDDTTAEQPIKKQEKPSTNSWDTSVSDDDTSISKPKQSTSNLQKTQPFTPSTHNLTSSESDVDSVETEIRRLDTKKPTNQTTIESLVNKQIGNGYKVIGLAQVNSPISEDSSWTTSPVPFNEPLETKGIQSLVQKPKSDESTWDDSRPLSVDLKTADDLSKEQKPKVENLTKIIETIMLTNKNQPSSKVVGKLMTSSMIDRTESALSENSFHEEWSVQDSKSQRQLPNNNKNNLHVSASSTKSLVKEVIKTNLD